MSDTLTNAEVEAWLSAYEKRRTGYFGVSVQENEAAKFARTILEERKAFKCEAAERIRLQSVVREALKLGRPWIDGRISYKEWGAAWQAIDTALAETAPKEPIEK